MQKPCGRRKHGSLEGREKKVNEVSVQREVESGESLAENIDRVKQ